VVDKIVEVDGEVCAELLVVVEDFLFRFEVFLDDAG
jgi:hypothetical protein